jgi:hypothetical protein
MRVMKLHQSEWAKRLFVFAVLCFGISLSSHANFSIQGHYQGKKLYVQSPANEDGFGFCINKVTLNGDIIPVDIYASAFQIDLSEYDIAIGQEVIIVFEHDLGCKPKLLNPEVLRPASTFVLQEIACTPDGVLVWSTTEESGKLNYLIEQYKWNKWVVVGEVNGTGLPTLSNYTFNVLPHSGENTIRVSQIDNTSKKRVSKSVSFMSEGLNEPMLQVQKADKTIEFLVDGKVAKTKYEIFDAFGNIVKKGFNSTVSYANLQPGVYHINYDNKNDRIIVK